MNKFCEECGETFPAEAVLCKVTLQAVRFLPAGGCSPEETVEQCPYCGCTECLAEGGDDD